MQSRGHLSVCPTFNPSFLSSSLPPTLPSSVSSFSPSSLTPCLPILIPSGVPLCLLSSQFFLVSIFSVFWPSFHSLCTFAVFRNSAPRAQCPLPINVEYTIKARTPAQSNCMGNNCKNRPQVEHSCRWDNWLWKRKGRAELFLRVVLSQNEGSCETRKVPWWLVSMPVTHWPDPLAIKWT